MNIYQFANSLFFIYIYITCLLKETRKNNRSAESYFIRTIFGPCANPRDSGANISRFPQRATIAPPMAQLYPDEENGTLLRHWWRNYIPFFNTG